MTPTTRICTLSAEKGALVVTIHFTHQNGEKVALHQAAYDKLLVLMNRAVAELVTDLYRVEFTQDTSGVTTSQQYEFSFHCLDMKADFAISITCEAGLLPLYDSEQSRTAAGIITRAIDQITYIIADIYQQHSSISQTQERFVVPPLKGPNNPFAQKTN